MVRLGLVVVLVGLWSQPAHAFERARPMGLYTAGGGSLAMVDSRIEVTVRGPIVETVVIQRFRNTGDRTSEATYIFPMPADAAVSAMAVHLGTWTIRAAIERRDAAQRRYEAAVAAGLVAALLEQERPDVFTQTISAIPAGGVVDVTLRYDTLARYEAGVWELAIPMVVAPRYVPGTASGRATTGSGRAPDTDRAPDASRVTPAASPGAGGSTAIAIHFVDEPGDLTSPTHELGGTQRDATLSDPHSDHDVIVRWRAPVSSAGWVERDGDAGFAAVLVEAPPAAPVVPRRAAIRFVLAIDRAATTRGDGDVVEHPLVRALLGALDRGDRVRVIGSDAIDWSAPDDVRAAIDRGWASPAGAFDLTRVLEAARPEGAPIVLVSDGLVADDPAAVAAARRLGVPVHVIGIGPAPARATLQHIAAETGGTLRYAVAGDDTTALARAALADVASPPAPLTVNWGTLAASEVEPAVLPRLGAGQSMLVLARVRRVQAANARARGELFAIEALPPGRAVDGATTTRGPLARRWARERLGDLLAASRDRAAVTAHAMSFGLVSPYTSLVAIGSEVVVQGGVKRSVAVPVSLPAGMQWQRVKQAIDVDTHVDGTRAPSAERDTGGRARQAPSTPPAEVVTPRVTRKPSPKAPPASVPTVERQPAQPAGSRPVDPRSPYDADRSDDERTQKTVGDEVIDVTGSTIARKETNTASPISIEGAAPMIDESAHAEAIAISGRPRALRIAAALGGGLAFDHGGRGLFALDVRLETSGRTRLGAEAALWLVGGVDPEGRALLTVARGGLARWFELGFGAGLHVGDGTGIAGALRLRAATPLRGVGGYLRYDAAVLLTRPSVEAEHALTLGLELSY